MTGRLTLKSRLMSAAKLPDRLCQRVNFAQDERGIAALEFAIIAPIILGVYLGLAELALALSIERQISHSASVAGDLATQVSKLEEADTADLISAVLRVADISDTTNYTVHIESYEREADGSTNSLGEIVYNAGGKSRLPEVDIDALSDEMLSETSGIVVARVAYRYSPMGLANTTSTEDGKTFLPSQVTFSESYMLKPRRSATIKVGSGTGTVFTCTGSAASMSCTD